MADIKNFKPDTQISFGEGIKSFWKNTFKWGGYATKHEFGWGFLFQILCNFLVGIISIVSFAPFVMALIGASGSNSNYLTGAALASLGGGLIVLLVVLLFCIPLAIASWSLQIRRMRSAGLSTGWIVGAILGPIVLAWFPFGGLLSLVVWVCNLIICFTKPSIADRGYEYTYWDVLTDKYNNPQPVPGFVPPQSASSNAAATATAPTVNADAPAMSADADVPAPAAPPEPQGPAS